MWAISSKINVLKENEGRHSGTANEDKPPYTKNLEQERISGVIKQDNMEVGLVLLLM